ncbi:MAG: thioredoxin domain-containing protein [Patescibacteria group bacterium]
MNRYYPQNIEPNQFWPGPHKRLPGHNAKLVAVVALLCVSLLGILLLAVLIFASDQKISQVISGDIGQKVNGNTGNLLAVVPGIKLASSSVSGTLTSISSTTSFASSTVVKNSARLMAERLDRPHLGNLNAPLVIVEFADFECPVCAQAFPAIREISQKYQNDVLYIFRQYPVGADNSMLAAQASLCANEQGKFWNLHDRLFIDQNNIATDDDFKNILIASGLDLDQLSACLSQEKYRTEVLEDMQDALNLNVQGTPTFFVNGNKVEGAVPADQWEQIISKYKELTAPTASTIQK